MIDLARTALCTINQPLAKEFDMSRSERNQIMLVHVPSLMILPATVNTYSQDLVVLLPGSGSAHSLTHAWESNLPGR